MSFRRMNEWSKCASNLQVPSKDCFDHFNRRVPYLCYALTGAKYMLCSIEYIWANELTIESLHISFYVLICYRFVCIFS